MGRNDWRAAGAWILSVSLLTPSLPAQDPAMDWEDAQCSAFGPRRDKFARTSGQAVLPGGRGDLTVAVARLLPAVAGGPAAASDAPANLIDRHIFGTLEAQGVRPAANATDAEFIRRVTLDLTGRIPTAERLVQFLNDADPAKRDKLVDELMARPEFVDKWTVFFADLYKNNSVNTQIRRWTPGVLAWNQWIRNSITSNKPYDQWVREMLTTNGDNSYEEGEVNWLAGGVVTGGPMQDIWDKQAVNAADMFLGVSHMDCLLCHSGRGHLDALSLWGRGITRQQAWGFASFFSRTDTVRRRVNPDDINPYYWSVADNTRFRVDYPLNTTTGNRPARQPAAGTPANVAPVYLFTGQTPARNENYRVALARFLTADPQFARASVNYLWEELFGIGIVTPSNQFDLARLDPANPPQECPPATPCELQPSHPQLLIDLAQYFVDQKFDWKKVVRLMVTSRAYQLSSRYNGEWRASYTRLFARKLVRRLMAEELHDAIAQASNLLPTYNTAAWGPETWAMRFPEPFATPDGQNGNVTRLLDAFFRGDRDDEDRRKDGSISQALGLMNDAYVMSRVTSTSTAAMLNRAMSQPDDQAVTTVFLNVLSRYPTDAERQTAVAALRSGNRSQEGQNLLWSLLNKVDFIYNY
jgi:hypothetical protein